jgi:signal peptidase II
MYRTLAMPAFALGVAQGLPFATSLQSVRSPRPSLNDPTEAQPTAASDVPEAAAATDPIVPGERLGPTLGGTRVIADYGRPTPSYAFLVLVSLSTLAADLGSKTWAEHRLDGYPGILEVWKNHLALILARNRGGAWGLLQSTSENVRRPFFLLVSVAAIAFIMTLYRRLQPHQRALQWGLPLVLGGALGNVFDRIRYGHVIDFIDAHIGEHHWPTFNVADIAICVGVGLMAVDMFTSKRGRAPVLRASEVPPAQSGEPVPDPYPWYPHADARDGDDAPPAPATEASPSPDAAGEGAPPSAAPPPSAPEPNQ